MENNITIKVGSYEQIFVIIETNAPKEYDYNGTSFEVCTYNKRRWIAVDKERIQYQTGRYSSGLYACEPCFDNNILKQCQEKIVRAIFNMNKHAP